jgi:hypothetical protein
MNKNTRSLSFINAHPSGHSNTSVASSNPARGIGYIPEFFYVLLFLVPTGLTMGPIPDQKVLWTAEKIHSYRINSKSEHAEVTNPL